MILRKCCRCKQFLPLLIFSKDKQVFDGLDLRCKCCRKSNQKENKKCYRNPKFSITDKLSCLKDTIALKKLFGMNYEKEHYAKYADYYKMKRAKRECGFKSNKKFKNPFAKTVVIEWHHINNQEIVAIPMDIHRLYCGCDRKTHRENLSYIVNQIYMESD